MAPNKKQIEAEILQLKDILPLVPKTTIFGENNHEEIQWVIRQLEQSLHPENQWEDPEDNGTNCREDTAILLDFWKMTGKDSLSSQWRETAGVQEIGTEEIEGAISIPAELWEGRCHEISNEILKANPPILHGQNPKLCYGHWLGGIHSLSRFAGRPICHHGWIQLQGNRVLDATRWVFEGREPYIYLGPNLGYDQGGQEIRRTKIKKPPPPDGPETIPPPEDAPAKELLKSEGINPDKNLAPNQAFHLANLPPKCFPKEQIEEVHSWLESQGFSAWIPIDFRETTKTR